MNSRGLGFYSRVGLYSSQYGTSFESTNVPLVGIRRIIVNWHFKDLSDNLEKCQFTTYSVFTKRSATTVSRNLGIYLMFRAGVDSNAPF